MGNLKVIASRSITNTASINVYEVNDKEEYLLAGINDQKPKRYKIYYNRMGTYFNYARKKEYLSEYMRTGLAID